MRALALLRDLNGWRCARETAIAEDLPLADFDAGVAKAEAALAAFDAAHHYQRPTAPRGRVMRHGEKYGHKGGWRRAS